MYMEGIPLSISFHGLNIKYCHFAARKLGGPIMIFNVLIRTPVEFFVDMWVSSLLAWRCIVLAFLFCVPNGIDAY